MKATPHMIAAGIVVLVCLIPTLPRILGGVPSYPIPTTDLTLPVPDAGAVVDRPVALDPLVPSHGGARSRNPFNLRPEVRRVGLDIPLPPPPVLALPEPPPLPKPEGLP